MELGTPHTTMTCRVATLEHPNQATRQFGWVGSRFVSNIQDYQACFDIDGESSLTWRQGLKHDCAKVMELNVQENVLVNGNGQVVKRFLRSVVFADAKRPYTKEVLMRINLARVASKTSLQMLREFWATIGYEPQMPIAESDWERYKQVLLGESLQQASIPLSA